MGTSSSKDEHHVHELVKECKLFYYEYLVDDVKLVSSAEIESLKNLWTLVVDSQNHFDLTFFQKTAEYLSLDPKFTERLAKSLHDPHDRSYVPFLQSMAM
jgi:hypothetical protein